MRTKDGNRGAGYGTRNLDDNAALYPAVCEGRSRDTGVPANKLQRIPVSYARSINVMCGRTLWTLLRIQALDCCPVLEL
jgi:hypothetical protein